MCGWNATRNKTRQCERDDGKLYDLGAGNCTGNWSEEGTGNWSEEEQCYMKDYPCISKWLFFLCVFRLFLFCLLSSQFLFCFFLFVVHVILSSTDTEKSKFVYLTPIKFRLPLIFSNRYVEKV